MSREKVYRKRRPLLICLKLDEDKLLEELKERHSQAVKDPAISNGVITNRHSCFASQPSTSGGGTSVQSS